MKEGCGRLFEPDNWYRYCGGLEMGDQVGLCVECGGSFKLKIPHENMFNKEPDSLIVQRLIKKGN